MESQLIVLTVLFILSCFGPTGSIIVKDDVYYTAPQQPQYVTYAHQRPLRLKEKEEQQDFSKIPGVPGVDYPVYHSVPHTNFDCRSVPAVPGMYANVETGCQAYHVCHDGREGHQGASFLCTNGTIFNQKEFACDWWYNVNCQEAPHFYSLNLDPTKNPYVPKVKPEEALPHHHLIYKKR
ncbi:conserved hypothetical protein [Pediculus humanus corporis]|uniref:Chitin-binding type-2 domain-containing protein n=1 Tax=Pediculus humanus subsp. corporis TaxID=121224 RepID=E0W339_PEDHC|nr:uncharacterized protein Phum_PHUM600940 [Pediculus humanus corporis]EEB20045.1 conserved hypothetical protein [Pediculus humanus corporis]